MNSLMNLGDIIQRMPIWEGVTIADFGSGSGIFTIEMAKQLNQSGSILAIDLLEQPLRFLMENAKRQNVAHLITTKVCDLENKTLGNSFQNYFDVVTIINVLFQVKNKEAMLKEAKRILKPNGFLIIVDWESYKIPLNEKLYPVEKNELISLVTNFDFKTKENIKLSNTHFGLIFIK